SANGLLVMTSGNGGNIELHQATQFTGLGTNQSNGANVLPNHNCSTDVNGADLEVASGTVSGSGLVTVSGTLNLTGGSLGGQWTRSEERRVGKECRYRRTLAADIEMKHAGTGKWTGTGNIYGYAGSVFNNSGVWD